MPPKGTVPNLFGESRVLIKKADGSEEWQEMPHASFELVSSDNFTDNENNLEFNSEVTKPLDFSIFFQAKPLSPMDDFAMKLFQMMTNPKGGTIHIVFVLHRRIKPRKTTYKTLRHDCAKRNGRR